MIKASEVRAKIDAAENAIIDSIKNSDEFKYVMQKLEFEIINATNNGKPFVEFDFDAMKDQHGNWQFADFFHAIVSELEANGYKWKLIGLSSTALIISW